MAEEKNVLSTEYFSNKKSHSRKKITNASGRAFEAMEIATQVLRLCYPIRAIKAVHSYFNNSKIEPFVASEQPEGTPVQNYTVVDIYFFFDDVHGTSKQDGAFVVEVAFPEDVERVRWQIARVRWADLGWDKPNRSPVPQLVGETIVSNWM